MPIVRFKNYGEIEVPTGTTILEAAQKLHAPEGYACGGVCACSTCHVYVHKGGALLTEMEDEENDILDKASPTQVGTDTDWQQVTGGDFTSCALKTVGSLWCWGKSFQIFIINWACF